MDNRPSTHLSVDDINAYLLGNPAITVRTALEAHCLQCPKCLADMCALTARIDRFQMAQEPVSRLISSTPGIQAPRPRRQPLSASQGRPWLGWTGRSLAASLVLMVLPDFIRNVRLDHLLDSPLTTGALNLPFTREYPSSLALFAMPKVELESAPPKKLTSPLLKPKPKRQRQFLAPQQHTRQSELVQVALLDAPDLNFADDFIDRLPKEIEVTPEAAAVSKPHIFKRFLSVIAAPFRSPRS